VNENGPSAGSLRVVAALFPDVVASTQSNPFSQKGSQKPHRGPHGKDAREERDRLAGIVDREMGTDPVYLDGESGDE